MEESTRNPVAVIAEWFNTLSMETRMDLGLLAFYPIPGMSFDPSESDEAQKQINDWLKDDRGDPLKISGKALCIRAMISFVVESKKEKLEGCEAQTLHGIEMFKERGDDHGVELMEKLLREIPFRKKKWEKISRSWSTLCKGPLRDQEIDRWLMDKMRPRR